MKIPNKMTRKRQRQKQVRRQRILLCGSVLVLLFLVVFVLTRKNGGITENGENTYQISDSCEAYRSLVETIAARYDMSDYVDLIMAVMMQESGGRGEDIMQSAEGAFNEKYPRQPNGIKDPIYSMECGIQELKSALDKAGATGPTDLPHIRQALQAYNFGLDYLDYASEKGVDQWNQETVAAFAEMASGGTTRNDAETQAMGKWNYGDQMYPEHVLRYYTQI